MPRNLNKVEAAETSDRHPQAGRRLAVIAGCGSGLGHALVNRFIREGCAVVGLSRSSPPQDIAGFSRLSVDLADPVAVERAFKEIDARHGTPSVLVHNAAELVRGPFLEQTAHDFERAWRAIVLTAVTSCRQAIPRMLANGGGTIILSGATASVRGGAGFAPFASAKFALRGLAGSLAREFQSHGIHVAHVVLDGILWSERSRQRFPQLVKERCLDPDDVAEAYWQLVSQAPSAWSHELDLRPRTETF